MVEWYSNIRDSASQLADEQDLFLNNINVLNLVV
jgi:hypothetical protein